MRLCTLSTLAGLATMVMARPMSRTATSLIAKDSTALQQRSAPYGKIITACAKPGTIALTFDDGPGAYTEDLLDILAASNVKATFFVNGDNGPELLSSPGSSASLKRAYDSGHQIASHTWSHQDLQNLTRSQRITEMSKLEDAFADILGVVPTYMRPPYTSCRRECVLDMANLGYHVVNYNIDTKDYTGDYDNAREVFSNSITQTDARENKGFIVLSHDIHPNTVYSLTPYMISEAEAAGYEMVTVGECLGDPVDNWYRVPDLDFVFPDQPAPGREPNEDDFFTLSAEDEWKEFSGA